MDGYIKIYRSLLNWEWYDDVNTKVVFLHLLLNANWKESKYHGYDVPAGGLVIGLNSLSKRLGISVQSLRTALNHLKSTGEITIKSTNKFSVITIANWEKFQVLNDEANKQINKQLTNEQQTTNKQLTTEEEYKNIRSKEYNNKSVSKFIPPSIDEVRQYCNERNNNIDPENFIDFYQSKGWKVGNQPMKDWKACVRTWERKQKPKKAEGISGNYDFDALENELRNN